MALNQVWGYIVYNLSIFSRNIRWILDNVNIINLLGKFFLIWRFGSQVFLMFFFLMGINPNDAGNGYSEYVYLPSSNTSQMVLEIAGDFRTTARLVQGWRSSKFLEPRDLCSLQKMDVWTLGQWSDWIETEIGPATVGDEWSRYCDMLWYDMFVACRYTVYTYTTIDISISIYLKYVRDL